MEQRFVGIDLGGSGTRAALADAEGRVLARGVGAAIGPAAGAAGLRRIARALDGALAAIGPLIADAACTVHAGATGVSLPGRRDHLALELNRRLPTAHIRITSDAQIALWGGLAAGAGVAVLSGTGSIALARDAQGDEARAGGWGYLLGDEGSGFWLGRAALATLLHVLEGRQPPGGLSGLVARCVAADGAPAIADVIAWPSAGPSGSAVARVAGLAPLVSRAAADGDPAARACLRRAGEDLAEMAATAARRLWPTALQPRPLEIVCCGGVWAAGALLRAPFSARLAQLGVDASIGDPRLPPVGGAVLLAMAAQQRALASATVTRVAEAFAHSGGASDVGVDRGRARLHR